MKILMLHINIDLLFENLGFNKWLFYIESQTLFDVTS